MSQTTPATSAAIVGLTLQNAGTGTLQAGVTTLGQIFQAGDVPSGQGLVARIGGATVPVQIDVKTTHPDGSAKMAVLAFERPGLSAGTSTAVTIEKAPAPSTLASVDLAAVSAKHALVVELTLAGQGKITIDVMDALRDALADGSASLWQKGPLATQGRVEVDLPGSMRLKFDVTAFKDGQISVDAGFANDEAMLAVGGRVSYDVVARLNGREVVRESVQQFQYQTWTREFESSEANGGQGLGASSRGWLNIKHDVAYLQETGAVAAYDLSIPVLEGTLNWYANAVMAPNWGAPLAANGVVQSMEMAGGRADLGFTTQHNVVWLMTGDPRVAAYTLGQAEAAGSAPWNFWDSANGTWLNTENYPRLWTDPRGGTGRPGDPTSGGLTQQVDGNTGWGLARSHQPDLSFVPYVLTGERWILDGLNAQSSWTIVGTWPAPRQNGQANMLLDAQVRSSAWAMRQIENAAWINPDGSTEKAYFEKVSQANWSWLLSKAPEWTERQGEAHGYLFGLGGSELVPWQQDYLAGITILAAKRGSPGAAEALDWMSNFLVGRFRADDEGFSIRDGVAYVIAIGEKATGQPHKTWEEIAADTIARGWSNTTGSGWGNSEGEYGRLGLATLAGLYDLTKDPEIAAIYRALLAEKPPFTDEASYSNRPAYAVTIPGIFDEFYPPTGTTSPGTGTGTQSPPPPPPPPTGGDVTPSLPPLSQTFGTGPDTLVLKIAQDYWKGSAQYTVAVDGNALGGTLTASALRTSGTFDTLTLRGDWGQEVTLTLRFLNDAWGGTPQTDRNLFLLGVSFNGDELGTTASFMHNGQRSFTLTDPTLPPPPPEPPKPVLSPPVTARLLEGTAGANTLTGGAGDDIIRGNGGADLLLGGGGANTFILGPGSGSDRIGDFTPGTDRLFFTGIDPASVKAVAAVVAGKPGLLLTYGTAGDRVLLSDVDRLKPGDLVFANVPQAAAAQTVAAAPLAVATPKPGFEPVSYSFGKGADALVLRIAQDFWQGDAQYAVFVNGARFGDVLTASSLRDSGFTDTVTLRGDWGRDNTLEVRFLNDAWGGTPDRDRNLIVQGMTLNGEELEGMAATRASNGSLYFGIAKPIAPLSRDLGSGPDTLVLKLSQDFWRGSAQFTVSVDGQQIGGLFTAAALRTHEQTDTITIRGNWGDTVRLTVDFRNDNSMGQRTADRNLHLEAVTLNGVDLGVSATLATNGARSFELTKAIPLPAPSFAMLLEGTAGADVLVGGAGDDIIRGGRGNDVLTGGAGEDSFIFAPGDGADRITDFTPGVDRLLFQGIAAEQLKAAAATVGGVAGLSISYGTAGDSVFLAGVTALAAGDLVLV